ncbi:MAG: hypothetical protein U0903_10430 [Planctomycetales bacterium]
MKTTSKAALRSFVLMLTMTSQSYVTAGSPGGNFRSVASHPQVNHTQTMQMNQVKTFKTPTQLNNNNTVRQINLNQGTLTGLNGTKTPISTLPTFPINPTGGTGTGGTKKPPFGGIFNPPNGGTVVVDPGPGNGGGKKPPFGGGIFNPPGGGVLDPGTGNPGGNNPPNNPPSNPPGGNNPPSNPPNNGGNCGNNNGNCNHGGCWGYGSYFPWSPWYGCYGGFACPNVQPYALPVNYVGMSVTPVTVPVASASQNVDLSIVGATILEKATATRGALVRVKILNKGPVDLAESARVALFGADANQTTGEMPNVIGNLPAIKMGETKMVDLRMPVEAARKSTVIVAIEMPANYKDVNEADNVAQGPIAQLPMETLAAK